MLLIIRTLVSMSMTILILTADLQASGLGSEPIRPNEDPFTDLRGWDQAFRNPKPFSNPQVAANAGPLPGASSDVYEVPEGLIVVGDEKVLKSRKTVIFVHGWARSGVAERFHEAALWNQQGYNTFMFRWHRDAFDRGLLPGESEHKAWNQVTRKFLKQFMFKLAPFLGKNYSHEFRLVGHSMGSQVATLFTYMLQRYRFPLLPDRLDLIDPYVGEGFIREDSPVFPWIFGSDNNVKPTKKEGMRFMLQGLINFPPKVPVLGFVSFASILSQAINYDRLWETRSYVSQGPLNRGQYVQEIYSDLGVYDNIHIQALKGAWLWDLFNTFTQFEDNFFEKLIQFFFVQHVLVKDAYMESIHPEEPTPKVKNKNGTLTKAFDAKTELSVIKKLAMRRYFKQVQGNETVGFSDDVFKREGKAPHCDRRIAGRIEFFKKCF